MDSSAALQAAWERQLSIQAALHQDEVYRLHKTIDALKDAVKRRDGIIRQMLDESCSLAELPVLSSSRSNIQIQNSAAVKQALPPSDDPLAARHTPPSEPSYNVRMGSASTSQFVPADVGAFVASAEVAQTDLPNLAKVASVLSKLKPLTARQSPADLKHDEWCKWSAKEPGSLLQARTLHDVLLPGRNKLRAPVPLLLRGVVDEGRGTWRAVLRLRAGTYGVYIRGKHERKHSVHAALDADAMERRFIPQPSLRRVNFAQEVGEWQVLGRRALSGKLVIAQLLSESEDLLSPESLAADAESLDLESPQPGTAHAEAVDSPAAASLQAEDVSAHQGLSAHAWQQHEAAARKVGVEAVLERQPVLASMQPLNKPKPLPIPKVVETLAFQSWVKPGVMQGEDGAATLVTRTPRTRADIPSANTLHIADGRLLVGVLAGAEDDEWVVHVVGTDSSGRRIARDARFGGISALAVALLSDALQRKLFSEPSDRRVNFAAEAGEWQMVPQESCGNNARQLFLQYFPDSTPGVPQAIAALQRKQGGGKRAATSSAVHAVQSVPSPGIRGLDQLSDELVLGMFAPPAGVDLAAVTPPILQAADVRREGKWQAWLSIVADGAGGVCTTTARRPQDISDEAELTSAEPNARLYTGVRQPSRAGRVNITVAYKTPSLTAARQRELDGTALQGALLHDRAQRLLLRSPALRRVNFAQEEGEWQIVLQRDKPANCRPLFVQYLPSKGGVVRERDDGLHSRLGSASLAGEGAPANKMARGDGDGHQTARAGYSGLQRPPAALMAAVRSGDAPTAAGGGASDDSAYNAWLTDIAARVTTDIVLPGQQDEAVSQYLSVARSAAARPLPSSAAARASLHHLVNGVERRLYRCIRSSPTVSGQFALRGQLASLVNEQTFDTPFAAALAADEAVRRSVPSEHCRLMNFKQPGSSELQYLPCSRNLRVSVYAAAPELASQNGTAAGGTAAARLSSKRGRSD